MYLTSYVVLDATCATARHASLRLRSQARSIQRESFDGEHYFDAEYRTSVQVTNLGSLDAVVWRYVHHIGSGNDR